MKRLNAVAASLLIFAGAATWAGFSGDSVAANIGQIAGLQKLAGRWTGAGSVKFDGGETETIKCIATYFLKQGGKQLQQNLRCTTQASYKISVRSELDVRGTTLQGTWNERKTNNVGTATGKITGDGFRLKVSGKAFKAAMQVQVTSSCAQSIRITPTGLGVKRIKINLRKC